MSTVSGYCNGPVGAIPKCGQCRVPSCTCATCGPSNMLANPVYNDERLPLRNGSLEATTKRPLGGASTPSIPGASPRLDLD